MRRLDHRRYAARLLLAIKQICNGEKGVGDKCESFRFAADPFLYSDGGKVASLSNHNALN